MEYKHDEKQQERNALMRLLANAENVGFMRYRFEDTRRIFIFDTLTGEFSYTRKQGVRTRKNIDITPKNGYPAIPLYFTDEDGKEVYCKIQIHRVTASLGNISRKLYKDAAIAALDAEGKHADELTLSVNHADCDKLNPYLYNLEWGSAKENSQHYQLARKLPLIDKFGRPNILRCGCDTGIGGRLRAGIYMTSERNPEAFGKYLINGANGATYQGEPYARYMSRQISEANLPPNIDFIGVMGRYSSIYRIPVAGRTIWQILGNCYEVKAVEVLPEGV